MRLPAAQRSIAVKQLIKMVDKIIQDKSKPVIAKHSKPLLKLENI